MVIVNTVVIVRGQLGLSQGDVALTLAAFGGGSILSALLLPRLLDRISDRAIMIAAATALTVILGLLAGLTFAVADAPSYWHILLVGWFGLGIAYSMSVTPSGRLLRRSAHAEDRPAIFAAQFALSHGCWLICYPLVGQVGAKLGQGPAFLAMAIIAASGTGLALAIWPRDDQAHLTHHHDLPPDHPHMRDAHPDGAKSHAFVIDDLHTHWPKS